MGFDPAQFARDVEQVLAAVEAGEVFGLLTRSLELPPGVACAVVDATGGSAWITEGRVEGGGAAELRFVRAGPFGLRYRLEQLSSRSGHRADLSLLVRVRVDQQPGSLEALINKLGQRHITLAQVQEALLPAVRKLVEQAVRERAMEQLLGPAGDWLQEVRTSLVPAAFACGLTVEGVEVLALTSPGFEQELRVREQASLESQRLEQRGRLAAAAAKQRAGELSAVQDTLAQVRTLAAAHPEVGMAQLLQQFSADLRMGLYDALLTGSKPVVSAGGPNRDPGVRWLVLTSRQVLVFQSLEKEPQVVSLPADLGVFRSLSAGGAGWLIGAQRGIWQTDQDFQPQQAWKAETTGAPQGGFNGAVRAGGRLIGTHTELGVLSWDLETKRPECLYPPDGRRIHSPGVLPDGRIVWAAGEEIWQSERGQASRKLCTLSHPCQALVVESGRLIAGLENGAVVLLDPAAAGPPQVVRSGSGRPVRSLHAVTMAGLSWVLIADGGPRLVAQVLGDAYAAEYTGRFPLHAALGSSLFLGGVDSLRARIVIWSVARPQTPLAVLEIKQRHGSSIQDAAAG